MTLGEYVKAYRQMHGLSQREFANIAGLSNTYISYLERGYSGHGQDIVPSIETYQAIARATGCTAKDLIELLDDTVVELPSFTPEEQQMILLFRKASGRDQKLIMDSLKEYE